MANGLAVFLGMIIGAVLSGVLVAGGALYVRTRSRAAATELPSSAEHVMDLLRRAFEGTVACLVSESDDPVVATNPRSATPEDVERVVAVGRLAMAEGREQFVSEEAAILGIGDGVLGVAVGFNGAKPNDDSLKLLRADLRRLVGEFRVDRKRRGVDEGPRRRISMPGLESLPAMVTGLCDHAWGITGLPCAVVIRNGVTERAEVVAISEDVDNRWMGAPVSPDSAAGRACLTGASVTVGVGEELFGSVIDNRRAVLEEGMAFPLEDGRDGVGSLVVFGGAREIPQAVTEKMLWLVSEAGPKIAAASAIRAAEHRAQTDVLTGLPNRAKLERAMGETTTGACAILGLDIDHFKQINDTYGHTAGDAALRHFAQILKVQIRDRDVAARVGGEEFVIWLPNTGMGEAKEVGQRIRRAVQTGGWIWTGKAVTLTVSIGVAAVPDTTSQIGNLMSQADAALYRAKKAGRNCVKMAPLAAR